MTSKRTTVQITDTDFEEYKRNAKEMERFILAAEKSYKRIVKIRGCSASKHGRTRHMGWVRIGNSDKKQ